MLQRWCRSYSAAAKSNRPVTHAGKDPSSSMPPATTTTASYRGLSVSDTIAEAPEVALALLFAFVATAVLAARPRLGASTERCTVRTRWRASFCLHRVNTGPVMRDDARAVIPDTLWALTRTTRRATGTASLAPTAHDIVVTQSETCAVGVHCVTRTPNTS